MQLFIKVVQGNGFMLEVEDSSTILELKKKIEQNSKVLVEHQTLLLVGKTLLDDKPLSFYPAIQNGTKLNLVIKKPNKEMLNVALTRFLQKYYSEAQSSTICDKFMKDFEQKIASLSLDDLERIATTYLNEESG